MRRGRIRANRLAAAALASNPFGAALPTGDLLLSNLDRAYQAPQVLRSCGDDGHFLAKYPFCFPLLACISRLVLGSDGDYVVGPVCTLLAGAVTYLLFRRLVRPFRAIIGLILWIPHCICENQWELRR
jgi:hypothetical protein